MLAVPAQERGLWQFSPISGKPSSPTQTIRQARSDSGSQRSRL